jgi:predicted metalloprotease with PDZ domain
MIQSQGRSIRLTLILVVVMAAVAGRAGAEAPEPIRYTLSFPAPHTHYVEVEAIVPAAGQPAIELMMAVWTPGSYLVREYSRHVERVAVRAPDGTNLPVTKTAKNRWRITTNGAPRVTVTYGVYGREMSVRTNWIDADFAMLNGAATYLTLPEAAPRPHEVTVHLPAAWKTSITGMADAPGGSPNHYRAPDFDTLVDSPIVAGNPTVHRFDVDGKPHLLVDVGERGVWDGTRAVADVERIVRADRQVWGALPYERYVFFNVLSGGGGGLEHRNSVMMLANRWATRTRAPYVAWLSLVSHEYFHAWNVKRLRPVELGPFDYEHEVYTRSLWIAEGITDYYGDLLLKRAGLTTEGEFLRQLSEPIRALQTTPGRLLQSAEGASFDAWIREYRRDENSPNVAISYYTKGAVVGFLLDARVRRASGGAKSLDDVMRLAFARYSGAHGYTPAQFRQTASEVAGEDLGPWFVKAVETTGELDYGEALEYFGLLFPTGGRDTTEGAVWLGLRTRVDAGRLLVSEVRRGTPAYDAGFNVDDEILAIDQSRVSGDQLSARLQTYRPGQRVAVLVARQDALRTLDVTLGEEPRDSWQLQGLPAATTAQQQHRAAWLSEKGTSSFSVSH